MATTAVITRHLAPAAYQGSGHHRFEVIAGEIPVLTWLAVREDIAGREIDLDDALHDSGWIVAGSITATGPDSWTVDLMPT